MTGPRIYTYKVTFEEVPYWYWGVHKEKKFGEFYLGSPKTHKRMWKFYTPKIQILEFFPNTNEGWEEAKLVENRLIKPDINNPLCLNEAYGGYVSLACCSEGGKIGGKKLHEAKDENGKSLHAAEAGRKLNEAKDENGKSVNAVKGAMKTHESRDENGKSLHAVETGKKRAEKMHKAKNENGKSVNAVKGGKKIHEAKDENGKSLHGVGTAKILNAQVWKSTVDGFRGNAGNVAQHNRANGWDPNARVKI
jgi:hypothetical protein